MSPSTTPTPSRPTAATGSTSTTAREPKAPSEHAAREPKALPHPPGESVSQAASGPAPVDPAAVIAEIQRLAWKLAGTRATTPAPGLVLPPAHCHRLEETLGLGATRDTANFVAAVERLASMRVGDIRIPFTPGQLAELQHRAQKRGRSLEAEMQAVVDRIQDELFYKGG